jgi:ankyrin repeat protein
MLISVILCNLVSEGNLHKIREILIGVEDLSVIMDYDFRTPLHIAALKDRGEIAQFLINRGAKVNALDRWRRTPLYEAVQNKSKKVAKILAMH